MGHLKLISSFLISTFLLPVLISAQVDLNIKYGAHISSAHTADIVDLIDEIKTPVTSHFLEATVGYDISPNFNISSGLNYKKKGFGLDYTINQKILGFNIPIGARAELNVEALSIPIKLKYRLPINQVEAYGFAGGGYSFHFNPEIRTSANLIGEIDISNIDVNNQVNNGETFGHLGIGAAVPAGTGKFFLEASYEHSFQNYTSDFILDIPLRNRGYTVGVGYSMPF